MPSKIQEQLGLEEKHHTTPAHLGDKAMVIIETNAKEEGPTPRLGTNGCLGHCFVELARPMAAHVVIEENFQARVLVTIVVARRRTHPGNRGTTILSETSSFKPTSNNSDPLVPSTFSHM